MAPVPIPAIAVPLIPIPPIVIPARPGFVSPLPAATLPWKVSVTYSLDGPNVEANEVAGASGLIGVYIDIKPQTKEANRTIPVVAFTVPTQVADDVSADNSITVTTQGSNTVVAAAGKAATGLNSAAI